MTPLEYRAAKSRLGLTHPALARALGVSERTSAQYAKTGAPERVRLALETLIREAKS